MRVLFLNWRCPKHPKAGGAEYVTMKLAQGLIAKGWEVTWFTAAFAGGSKRETVDGVKVVRAGNPLTVQREAKRWYRQQPPSAFDLVIDQSHGLPFFAPAWVSQPCIYFIHEVTGKIANYMVPWPLGPLYQVFERYIIRFYRDVPALTVSNSTKAELRQYGHRASICVLTNGMDTKPLITLPPISDKEAVPTVIMAARLVPLKRPDEAIKMQAALVKKIPNARLWILGNGDDRYVGYLKKLVSRLNITDSVKFWGFVSLAKKQELMRRAHVVTITSIKEGWGLTIPEANALGTVGVTYNISGVKDSNRNGVLSKTNSPGSLALAIAALVNDKAEYQRLRLKGWEWSKTLKWANTNQAFYRYVEKVLANAQEGHPQN